MADINREAFVDIVKSKFSDSDINRIVEVGALDGEDAAYFKRCFSHASVTAIEGLKENWENHSPKDIEWLNLVISDYDGDTDYHVKLINGIHGMYDRGKIYGTEIRKVKCHRLDSIIKDNIDMMKIDVEGATFEVLSGMGELLKTVKIMHIETESIKYFAGQKKLHSEMCSYLTTSGFTCLRTQGARIETGHQYDSVWINNDYMDS